MRRHIAFRVKHVDGSDRCSIDRCFYGNRICRLGYRTHIILSSARTAAGIPPQPNTASPPRKQEKLKGRQFECHASSACLFSSSLIFVDKYVSSMNVNLIIPPILGKFKFTNEEFVMKRIVFGTKNNPRTAQPRDCQVLHAHGRPRIELPRVLGAGRQPNARTHSRPRPRQVGGMFLRSGG